jgi:fermentation-respiration switch protein FrsA (DUF1100 family)
MTIGILLKSLLVLAATAYAVVVAVMFFAQRSLLYPGASRVSLPATAPWGERVSISTADGETLAALYAPPAPGMPTFLLFPGNGDRIVNYSFLADPLAAKGYGLLALAYRGYPGSTGTPSETGLLIDGLAAFDWLAERSTGQIILLGWSLGTGVAVATAAERQAAMLILVASYDSILAIARDRYSLLPVGLLLRDTFRSDLRIAQVSEPKIFLHGSRDVVIPLASGQALYDAAPQPKEFRIADGYGHGDIWSPATIAQILQLADTGVERSAP